MSFLILCNFVSIRLICIFSSFLEALTRGDSACYVGDGDVFLFS